MNSNLVNAYELCVKKIELNTKRIGCDLKEFPGVEDGQYFSYPEKCFEFFHIMNWSASFFTGMGLIAFETKKDIELLKWLNSNFELYYQKIVEFPNDTMHDLGFLYSPYSIGLYKLTGDINNKKVAILAADALAKRFVPNGGYIRAWGRMDNVVLEKDPQRARNHFYTESQGLAIIDCMMNLPLLFWASKETGNPYYKNIAIAHADTTLKYFIREDYSVYHSFRFDPVSGSPIGGCNYCGYGSETYWARGATWAIYGFALAYKYTKNKAYLETSVKLAHKFIENLDDSIIPVWDFRLPEGEAIVAEKDTSAAAIAACAFMEITKYVKDELISSYADKLILKLTDEEYMDSNLECPGILKQSNGRRTYTTFGDYFFMEALARKLYNIKTCW